MDYRELLEKYNLLLSENSRLIKENDRLKARLGIAGRKPAENRIAVPTAEKSIRDDELTDSASFSGVNNRSDSISKIRLFMSLFKGRDDVYAKKWENKKKGNIGIFTGLPESMAGWIVRQAKGVLLQMRQSII